MAGDLLFYRLRGCRGRRGGYVPPRVATSREWSKKWARGSSLPTKQRLRGPLNPATCSRCTPCFLNRRVLSDAIRRHDGRPRGRAAMKVLCFSSFSFGYLNRARVLFASPPEISDPIGASSHSSPGRPAGGLGFSVENRPFDSVHYADRLDIRGFGSWIYKHDVIEALAWPSGQFSENGVLQRSRRDRISRSRYVSLWIPGAHRKNPGNQRRRVDAAHRHTDRGSARRDRQRNLLVEPRKGEVLLLSKIKRHLRDELAHIPNYTCLETITRFPLGGKSAVQTHQALKPGLRCCWRS